MIIKKIPTSGNSSVGVSGGIWLFWNDKVGFMISVLKDHHRFIHFHIKDTKKIIIGSDNYQWVSPASPSETTLERHFFS